jgi:hypothetical protein
MTDLPQLQDAARSAVARAIGAPTPGTARGAVEAIRALQVAAPGSPELATIAQETAEPMLGVVGVAGHWWGWIYDALNESLEEDGEFRAVLVTRSDLEILRTVYRDVVDDARLDEYETKWVDEMIRARGDDYAPFARPQWVPASHWWWDWSDETPERVRAALDAGDPFDVVFRIRRLHQHVEGTDAAVARLLPTWWERACAFLADEDNRDVFLARVARSNFERVREVYAEAAASIDTAELDTELRRYSEGGEYDGGGVPPRWIESSDWWWGRS